MGRRAAQGESRAHLASIPRQIQVRVVSSFPSMISRPTTSIGAGGIERSNMRLAILKESSRSHLPPLSCGRAMGEGKALGFGHVISAQRISIATCLRCFDSQSLSARRALRISFRCLWHSDLSIHLAGGTRQIASRHTICPLGPCCVRSRHKWSCSVLSCLRAGDLLRHRVRISYRPHLMATPAPRTIGRRKVGIANGAIIFDHDRST